MGCLRMLLAIAPPSAATIVLCIGACGGGDAAPAGDAAAGDEVPAQARNEYDGASSPSSPSPSPPSHSPPTQTPVHAEFTSTPVRTDTMQLMFAAGEMQTSGEPFASGFGGRILPYFQYTRYQLPTDQYGVPCTHCGTTIYRSVTDLFGFSTAVESYEYSKYHMNIVANQSGAGVSLINGPIIATLPGATLFDKLRARMAALIAATGADVTNYAKIPPPANNPENDFGFPGLWPNMNPYRSFDTTMAPDTTVVPSCTSAHGYGGVAQYGNQAVFRYECDYNSLRLRDRAQAEHVIGPGILGFAVWKEALWAIDFTGRLHDSQANSVSAVSPGDVALIGKEGNQVQAVEPPAPQSVPGVFIGSTPLEGMWGLTMVDEIDNAGAWLLSSLATADGATLSGWPSVSAAIAYDYGSPLIWFPSAIGVTEQATAGGDGGTADRYPLVTGLTIQDPTSRSVDLAALAQGYSLFFGMTDGRNVGVGQQTGMQVAFGGAVFAADNGKPDGENTPHDRSLGVMRVAFVDLDRIHVDPATHVVVDSATVSGGGIVRGTTVTTTTLGHVVVGLRHLLMACNAAVSQYGAPDGDPTKDMFGIFNSVPIHPNGADAGSAPTFSERARQVLTEQAQFVRDVLTTRDGAVKNGATLTGGRWSAATDATTLEAQSAALRVLVEASFLTRDPTYADRAAAVARRLLVAFWSEPARMFRGLAGGPDEVLMTPERFAWLQQALRETYKSLWVSGDPLLDRAVLEDRISRVNKLYLNGWDDVNGNQRVEKPAECLGARLQLGEQALTGEIGTTNQGFGISFGPDRESDCVLNIAYSKTASVLAGSVRFHSP